MLSCLRSKRGAKYEPKEYVSEYENGRSNQEDEQSGSELVPNDFPLHVLRLFLEEVRALIPYACEKVTYLAKKAFDFTHNVCHIYLRSS